jgi:hypothetical protein
MCEYDPIVRQERPHRKVYLLTAPWWVNKLTIIPIAPELTVVFDPNVRLLVCTNCEGVIEVPVRGGYGRCSTCGSGDEFAPFEPAPDFDPGGAGGDEGRRLAALREQDGTPVTPPSHVVESIGPSASIEEMVGVFSKTAAEVRQEAPFAVHERLFFLTTIIAQRLGGRDDRLLRAVLQTSVEQVDSARYRQALYALLARSAARVGDYTSAEGWLELVDPRSDDLLVDTSYRLAHAEMAASRSDYPAVLSVLGTGLDQVPTVDNEDEYVELLRSDALERLGRNDEAVEQLKAAIARSDVSSFEAMRARSHLDLCPTSFAQAVEAAEQDKSGSNAGWIGMLAFVPMLIFPVMLCFSGGLLKGCTPGAYELAMTQVRSCPAAVEVLGDDIGATVGVGCGNLEVSGGHGYVDWDYPISGSRGRGKVYLNAVKRGGDWRIDRLELGSDGETIDILACTSTGAKGAE